MESLFGYGSDDDEPDSNTEIQAISKKSIDNSKTVWNPEKKTESRSLKKIEQEFSSSSFKLNDNVNNFNDVKKKRKKLNLSFLPSEIQKALVRGRNADDSDSDADDSNPTPISSNKMSTSLLSILPKPKIADASNDDGAESFGKAASKSREAQKIESKKKESSTKIFKVMDRNLDEESDDDDDSISMPPEAALPNQTIFLKIKEAAVPSKTEGDGHHISAEKSQIFDSVVLPKLKVSSAPLVSNDEPTRLVNTAHVLPHASSAPPGPQAFPNQSQDYAQYYGNPSLYNQNSSYVSYPQPSSTSSSTSTLPQSSSSTSSRRRERDLEKELLSGNISSIDDAAILTVNANREDWNPYMYNEQQKKEAQLMSAFNFGQKGTENMIAQPTKLQNRRHQINSLAFNATQIELELMEAKAKRNKTKSETQSKYGW